MNFDIGSLTIMSTTLTALVSGLVSYQIAKVNVNKDRAVKREDFMDSQMKLLVEGYQKELTELREDISSLVTENQQLRIEVVNLKSKIIELEVYTHGK